METPLQERVSRALKRKFAASFRKDDSETEEEEATDDANDVNDVLAGLRDGRYDVNMAEEETGQHREAAITVEEDRSSPDVFGFKLAKRARTTGGVSAMGKVPIAPPQDNLIDFGTTPARPTVISNTALPSPVAVNISSAMSNNSMDDEEQQIAAFSDIAHRVSAQSADTPGSDKWLHDLTAVSPASPSVMINQSLLLADETLPETAAWITVGDSELDLHLSANPSASANANANSNAMGGLIDDGMF